MVVTSELLVSATPRAGRGELVEPSEDAAESVDEPEGPLLVKPEL